MKSKKEWNQNIINITMEIHQKFPELSKYIKEMPVQNIEKDKTGINTKKLEEYYNSLVELVATYSKTHGEIKAKNHTIQFNASEYPLYPPSEDIYNQGKKEMDLNPNDLSKKKTLNVETGAMNEKKFSKNISGNDLDVPGSELDDE